MLVIPMWQGCWLPLLFTTSPCLRLLCALLPVNPFLFTTSWLVGGLCWHAICAEWLPLCCLAASVLACLQALVMAGFRAEEYAVVRATLDSLGGHDIKVLPTSNDMLSNSVEWALQQPEIDWTAPRPPEWVLGGTWGSQRTILFSGECRRLAFVSFAYGSRSSHSISA